MDFATITSSVVLSACVAGVVSLVNGAWQRKSERTIEAQRRAAEARAKIREMALTLALKEWELHQTISKAKGYSSCWNFFAIRTRPGIHRHADVFMLDFHESSS